MNKITGNIKSINGCKYGNTLSIEIETSDEISLTELIGKDVEVTLLREKIKEKTSVEKQQERTEDAFLENHSPSTKDNLKESGENHCNDLANGDNVKDSVTRDLQVSNQRSSVVEQSKQDVVGGSIPSVEDTFSEKTEVKDGN